MRAHPHVAKVQVGSVNGADAQEIGEDLADGFEPLELAPLGHRVLAAYPRRAVQKIFSIASFSGDRKRPRPGLDPIAWPRVVEPPWN